MANPTSASGLSFALSAMLAIQVGNVVAVELVRLIGVADAIALRMAFSSAFLWIVLRPVVRTLSGGDRKLVLAFGVTVAGMTGSIYGAITHLPVAVATTIGLLGPLSVAAFGSRRRRDLTWPALAFAGVVLMALGDDASNGHISWVGTVFGLGSALFWGTYIVLSARAGSRFDGIQGLALATTVAAAIWVPIALLSGGGVGRLSWVGVGVGAAAGVVATGLPYMLENLALRRLPRSTFAILASLEPAIAALLGLAVLSQSLTALIVGGMALVTVASAGAARATRAPATVLT